MSDFKIHYSQTVVMSYISQYNLHEKKNKMEENLNFEEIYDYHTDMKQCVF